PVSRELRGVGALEAEDRLLLVADDEQGARRPISRSCVPAGEEFLGTAADDPPLLPACVLAFVDQDVIEASFELVQRPGRSVPALEQAQRLGNQIVIVQRAPR